MAYNLKKARMKCDPDNYVPTTNLKSGDSVLLKDHISGTSDPVCRGDVHNVSLNVYQIDVMPATGGKT